MMPFNFGNSWIFFADQTEPRNVLPDWTPAIAATNCSGALNAANCFGKSSILRSSIGRYVLEDRLRTMLGAIFEPGQKIDVKAPEVFARLHHYAPVADDAFVDDGIKIRVVHCFWTMVRLNGRSPDVTSTRSLLLPSCRSRYSLIAWISWRSTPRAYSTSRNTEILLRFCSP